MRRIVTWSAIAFAGVVAAGLVLVLFAPKFLAAPPNANPNPNPVGAASASAEAIASAFPTAMPSASPPALSAAERLAAESNARTAVLQFLLFVAQLLGALLIGGGLVYTARNYRLAAQTHAVDRFTTAIERLDSKKLYMRTAGVRALESVMRESPELGPDVAEVLAAFIRQRARRRFGGLRLPGIVTAVFPHRASDADEAPAPANGSDGEARTSIRRGPRPDVQAALTAFANRHRHYDIAHDRSKLDLSGTDLADAVLAGANLSHANLSRTNLNLADLTDADLRSADLTEAIFVSAELTGARLDQAEAQEADFLMARMDRASLCGGKFAGADLSGASLRSANLRGAYLQGLMMIQLGEGGRTVDAATTIRTDLAGADLTNPNDEDHLVHREGVLSDQQLAAAEWDDTTILPLAQRLRAHKFEGPEA